MHIYFFTMVLISKVGSMDCRFLHLFCFFCFCRNNLINNFPVFFDIISTVFKFQSIIVLSTDVKYFPFVAQPNPTHINTESSALIIIFLSMTFFHSVYVIKRPQPSSAIYRAPPFTQHPTLLCAMCIDQCCHLTHREISLQ